MLSTTWIIYYVIITKNGFLLYFYYYKCTQVRYMLVTPLDDIFCQPPLFIPFCILSFAYMLNQPFYLPGNPPFDLVVQMLIHSRPWLVVNLFPPPRS